MDSNLFCILAGLAFFIFGISEISLRLEKIKGGRIERALKKVNSGRFRSLVLGAGITVAIQSSTALTEVLVGLVNSGIMQLGQTIGIMMGSNIGTTFTSWITALFCTDNNPEIFLSFVSIIAFAGIIMKFAMKKDSMNDIGTVFFSFAMIVCGMGYMQDGFINADITGFTVNPLICFAAGIIITALLGSSAASVALLQAFSVTGVLTPVSVISIIMGQNIGTCISAVVSSRNANKNARRVSFVHLYFNITGTVVLAVLLFILGRFINFNPENVSVNAFYIAAVHTLFNVFTSLILIPFSSWLEKLAVFTIKGEDLPEEKSVLFLDERLLNTPSFALTECRSFSEKMAQLSFESFRTAIETMSDFDEKKAEKVTEQEDLIDDYEDKLGTYLIKLSGCSLTNEDAASVSNLLHCIGDFERISDHAVNLAEISREMHEKNISFSHAAQIETEILETAVSDILEMAITAFINNDAELARRVEPLEEVIDGLRMELKNRHVRRLQQDKCTIELGFIFSDLLTNLERISDHCSNIAVCLIQLKDEKFDTHEYITNLRVNDKEFQEMRFQYVEKYSLPD